MNDALQGKRILVTQAAEFMGPALCEVLAERGAQMIASAEALVEADAAGRVVRSAEVGEDEWRSTFAAFVDSLPRLVRAAPPEMTRRRSGKILVGAREDAQFAAYLCSDAADCFVGQVFPVCGGWVGR